MTSASTLEICFAADAFALGNVHVAAHAVLFSQSPQVSLGMWERIYFGTHINLVSRLTR